ncbi:MAG: hypothetical protein ACTSVI_07665 [Promethearchaeota archaeon]
MKKKTILLGSLLMIFITSISLISLIQVNGSVNYNSTSTREVRNSDIEEIIPAMFPGRIASVDRTIRLDNYGVFFVSDNVTFVNDKMNPIQKFYYCLNVTQSNHLYELFVIEKGGNALQINKENYNLNGYALYEIILNKMLFPGDSIQFTIFQYFQDKIETSIGDNGLTGTFYFSLFTIVPYYATVIRTGIVLPSSSIINKYLPEYPDVHAGKHDLDFTAQNSAPFNYDLLFVNFTTTDQNVVFVETESSKMSLILTEKGDIQVSNNILVKNIGKNNITDLIFTVPADAYNFVARDYIGFISGVKQADFIPEDALFKNISINLLLNRYTITPGHMFQFTFSFTLPAGNRVKKGSDDNILIIDIGKICRVPWVAKDEEIWIGLPQSTTINVELLQFKPEAVDNIDGTQFLIYKFDAISSKFSKNILIHYNYSSIGMQTRPLLIGMIVAIVSIFLIMGRRILMNRQITTGLSGITIPADSLKEFTSIFEEKIRLFLDLDTINEDLKRRKIKKREYLLRCEENEKKLKKLDADIVFSKKKLVEFGGRIKEIVDELDVLESERQAVQESLINLEKRYMMGKMKSRAAFEKLYDDYAVNLRRIQSALDSGLAELKSYFL